MYGQYQANDKGAYYCYNKLRRELTSGRNDWHAMRECICHHPVFSLSLSLSLSETSVCVSLLYIVRLDSTGHIIINQLNGRYIYYLLRLSPTAVEGEWFHVEKPLRFSFLSFYSFSLSFWGCTLTLNIETIKVDFVWQSVIYTSSLICLYWNDSGNW